MTPLTLPPVPDNEDGALKVYRLLKRYERAKFFLHLLTVSCVLALLGLVLLETQNASESRDQLSDCIKPTGQCAQRGAQQGINLISASIVCSQRNLETKAQAVACVKEVLGP